MAGRGVLRWLSRLGWAAGATLVAAVTLFSLVRPVQVLPRLQVLAPFELTDQQGRPFRSHERGRTVLYAVGASREQELTPRTLELLASVGQRLEQQGWLGSRVELAFITIDPEHDSVAVAAQLAQRLRAGPGLGEGVSVLTGSPVAVKLAVGGGLQVYYRPPAGPAQQPRFSYDPVLVLVDPWGFIRARYRLTAGEASPERVLRHIGLVVQEAAASGVSRWVYEGTHLFLCIP